MMRRAVYILGGVGLLLFAAAYILGDMAVLASSQVGYWSSALVMGASLESYRRMVAKRAESGIYGAQERDIVERIEDPHDLYTESEEKETVGDIAAALKAEKIRMKNNRRPLSQTVRDSSAALSPLRMGAYGMLVLGFFYLRGSSRLDIASYLLSLGLPVVLVVGMLLRGEGER